MTPPPSMKTCHEVTPDCPVSATTYGYRPNKGANTVFLIIFFACAVAQLGLGWRFRKTWKGYSILVAIGALLEAIGYVGRVQMSSNPWSQGAFIIQVTMLVIAPSLMAASLYMTMKSMVLYFGEQYSRLPARWWTKGFVIADLIGFIIQAGGGSISSMAKTKPSLVSVGTNMTLAGIAFQTVVMSVAALLFAEFMVRVVKQEGSRVINEMSRGLKFFLVSMSVAFVAIIVRCIYRIPEMAAGYGKGLMRHELEFIIFDGAMIALAVILQTIAHPGIFASETRGPAHHAIGSKPSSIDAEQGLQDIPMLPQTQQSRF